MTVHKHSEAGNRGENAVRVCVRVRPLNDRERKSGAVNCVAFDAQTHQVVLHAPPNHNFHKNHGKPRHGFAFDHSYGPKGSSRDAYADCVAPLVENVAKGYNSCVLAYGQTCSGKTYTMSGGTGYEGVKDRGIIPEAIEHLFILLKDLQQREQALGKSHDFKVTASAMEIYNEELKDLGLGFVTAPGSGSDVPVTPRTASKRSRPRIDIRDNRDKASGFSTEIVGLSESEFTTSKDLLRFFSRAGRHRTTTATMMNDRSSRSHEIFMVTVEQTSVEYIGMDSAPITQSDFEASGGRRQTSKTMSRLHLVDLAGSERVKKSGVGGKELKEASSINSGLLTLGNVICALADRSEGKATRHIPYRDVKLTRVLQDSLGGNSMTTLISCISPADSDFDESFNTLQYASRACKIKNVELSSAKVLTTEEGLPFAAASVSTLLQHLDEAEPRPRSGLRRWDECNDLGENLVEVPCADGEDRRFTEDYNGRKAAAIARRNRAAQYDMLRRKALGSYGAQVKNFKGNMTVTGNAVSRRSRIGREGEVGTPRPRLPTAPRSQPPSRRTTADAAASPAAPPPAASKTCTTANKEMSFANWMAQMRAEEEAAAAEAAAEAEAEAVQRQALDGNVALSCMEADEVGEEEPQANVSEPDMFAGTADGEEMQPLIEIDVTAENVAHASAARMAVDKCSHKSNRNSAASGVHVTEDTAEVSDLKQTSAVEVIAVCNAEHTPSEDCQETASDLQGLHQQQQTVDACASPAYPVSSDPCDPEPAARGVHDEEVTDAADPVPGTVEGNIEIAQHSPLHEMDSDLDPLQKEEDAEVLVRFRVNQNVAVTVHKACTKEDFDEVVALLPHNTPLPSSDRMIYLLARVIEDMETGEVGRAVGCLMASIGTCMISSCIYSFEDPQDVEQYHTEERVELWGLQIPQPSAQNIMVAASSDIVLPGVWCSADRLTMSIGLLFGLCCYADDNDIRAGFCVPRPQLLERWMSSGVPMHGLDGKMQLIYPPNAHDFHYYRSSTVAYFLVDEVIDTLGFILTFL